MLIVSRYVPLLNLKNKEEKRKLVLRSPNGTLPAYSALNRIGTKCSYGSNPELRARYRVRGRIEDSLAERVVQRNNNTKPDRRVTPTIVELNFKARN